MYILRPYIGKFCFDLKALIFSEIFFIFQLTLWPIYQLAQFNKLGTTCVRKSFVMASQLIPTEADFNFKNYLQKKPVNIQNSQNGPQENVLIIKFQEILHSFWQIILHNLLY